MELTVNRKPFLNEFLTPLNKISDKGIFVIKRDGIECLSCSAYDKKEQTIILYTKYLDTFEFDQNVQDIRVNIPNIAKLISVFSFLREDQIKLVLDNNSISYKSSDTGMSFRYHLLEDGVLEIPTVNMNNIYKMGFDFECSITNSTLKTLLKGSSFADQTNKIYLYTKDGKVHGLLTDENIKNIDNIEFVLSDVYAGFDIKKKIPMSLEIYRVISMLNFDTIQLKINVEKGIIMFEIKTDNYLLQYIVTALVK